MNKTVEETLCQLEKAKSLYEEYKRTVDLLLAIRKKHEGKEITTANKGWIGPHWRIKIRTMDYTPYEVEIKDQWELLEPLINHFTDKMIETESFLSTMLAK